MARQRTDVEQLRADVLKAVRTAIRLKHSLAADREMNEVLPEVERELEAAIKSGTGYELDVADFLRDQGEA